VEDDGISTEYIKGEIARTQIDMATSGVYAGVRLGATKGTYAGIRQERNWIVRFHLPKGISVAKVMLDGKPVPYTPEAHAPITIPFRSGAAPDEGEVIPIKLPTTSIRKEHAVVVEMKAS
jgi:hypothetical protein